MAAISNFLKKIFGFNVFEILSINKKYLDFANSKWRTKCTKIQKKLIKSCVYSVNREMSRFI